MARIKADKNEAVFRTPHTKSAKVEADRYRTDREEAMEFTDSFSTNRKGGHKNYPDDWDDMYTSDSDKYPVKPKKNDRKGKDTIRRPAEDTEDVVDDEE